MAGLILHLLLTLLLISGCAGEIQGEDEGPFQLLEEAQPEARFRPGDAAAVCNTTGSGLQLWSTQEGNPVLIALIPEGERTTVLVQRQAWIQHRWQDQEGWSEERFLCPAISPAPPPAPPAPPPPPPSEPPPAQRLGLSAIVGGSVSVSQAYGPTSFSMDYSYCKAYGSWPAGVNVHCGIDLVLSRGTALRAPEAATVITAGGSGYFTDYQNPEAGELRMKLADGTLVIFGHLSQILVTAEEKASTGQKVGLSGSTSKTGGHLHLEVRVPDKALKSGYRTVDPAAFFGP